MPEPPKRFQVPPRAEISIKRVVVRPERAPEVLSRVFFTALGDSMQLEVGHLDLTAMAQHLTGPAQGKPPVDFYVTHRFSLSVEAVSSLKEAVDLMLEHLRTRGTPFDAGEPPS